MKPRTLFLPAAALALLLAAIALPRESSGQAGSDDFALQNLVTELTAQQAKLAENQSRIDEKLAVIAEDLRLARIFAGRGGGKTNTP